MIGLGGVPADRCLLGVFEGMTARRLVDVDRPSVQLEVAEPRRPVGLRRDHGEARITQQIERLLRPPHHAQHQVAVDDVGLAWADPRRAAGANGAEQHDPGVLQALFGELGELGRGGGELPPVRLVVLRGFVLQGRFLGSAIPGVASEHPPAEADHTSERDQKGEAHEQPRRHPFADEKEHDSNYRQDDERLAPSRVLPGRHP